MFKPITIPRETARLLTLGNCFQIQITDDFDNRPDRVSKLTPTYSMIDECVNNYINNVSPITFKKGNNYLLTDNTILSGFVNGTR